MKSSYNGDIKNSLRNILIDCIRNNKDPFPSIIGQDNVKRQIISSLLAGRNILIVGPPGIGKTTLAKDIAKLLPPLKFPKDLPLWAHKEFPFVSEEYLEKWNTGPFIEIPGDKRFIRIQGSYDLSVEDLIGDIDPSKALKYGIHSVKSFIPGKIFYAHKGVLFFDEINRAPPKVQNILLQLLEEKTITIGTYEFEIPIDIILIATMNPEDYYGTENLSDVLLDRFDIVFMDYPSPSEEKQIILSKAQKFINFPEKLLDLIVEFISSLRQDDRLEKKPSVRASIGIYEKAQTLAILDKKSIVELNHIYEALLSILPHRIRLKPSHRIKHNELEFIKTFWNTFIRGNPSYLRR